MSHFLIGFAIGGAIVACIGGPLVAPWSIRVRYLAAAPAFDPWLGLDLGLAQRLEMRAVKLVSVETDHGDVECVVADVHGNRGCRQTLTRPSCPPRAVAELDGWLALRTPLLLIIDHRLAHVYGPDGAVTNFGFVRERVG